MNVSVGVLIPGQILQKLWRIGQCCSKYVGIHYFIFLFDLLSTIKLSVYVQIPFKLNKVVADL